MAGSDNSDTCIKNEAFEVQDNEFQCAGTSGDNTTLNGHETDIKTEVDPLEIGGEVATTSLLTNTIPRDSRTCEICSKMFKDRNSLVRHLRSVHKICNLVGCIPFTCFVCNQSFAQQCDFLVHLLSHSGILQPLFSIQKKGSCTFACKICGVTQQNTSAKVVQHIKSVHLGLKEYKCKVCSTYYKQKCSVIEHFSLQHSLLESFTCKVCSYESSKSSLFKKHILTNHKFDKYSAYSLLPAQFIRKSSLICKVCNVAFKSRDDLYEHISDVHEGLDQIKCPVCQKEFTCIVQLINHLCTHQGGTNNTIKQLLFSCGMCEERFSTENDRSTHLVNFHNKSPDGSSGISTYECDKCKKVFTTFDLLKKHNIELHNSNSFSCFKCNKCGMFGSFDNFKKHIDANHATESSVTFSVCTATFSSLQSLKIHLAIMHENTFETSQYENTELITSSYTNIGIVKCKICKQDFANPTSLKNHFNEIHKINEKQTSLQQNRRERQKVSQREHRTAEYLKNRLGSSPVKPQLQQAVEGEKVTRYLARLDKREEGTVGSSTIEDLPPPLATPLVRVYPSHPCGRVGVTSDCLLSAATSSVGLVCNNIGPRAIVEPKQLCVVNSGDGEVSSNNCIQSSNLALEQLGIFEEMYIKSEPFFF